MEARVLAHKSASCSYAVQARKVWASPSPHLFLLSRTLKRQAASDPDITRLSGVSLNTAQPEPVAKGHAEEEQNDHTQAASEREATPSGLASLESEIAGGHAPNNKKAGAAAGILSVLGVLLLLGGGYLFKDQIKTFLEFFISVVEDWGPLGYAAYAGVYIVLEVLALPAIPLTMTAGVIFGTVQGTMITSLSGTVAATIAFLISRYLARDKIRQLAYKQPKFAAIDKAIGANGLKFVTLLRLSPLLPLAASNYLYGLTSVDLGSYVLGSWIGMLPGTYAYVHAGYIGRAVFMEGEGSLSLEVWQIALGLGATLLALGFVGHLAKKAIDEVEQTKNDKEGSGI